ncbi:hypothetical protein CF327_g7594 [Tilletia walkeri]|nr:hypothetical protein CF327_g7594 [Tilletia walkeri]
MRDAYEVDNQSDAYNLRNSLNEEAFASKLDADDKTKLQTAIDESISWLDGAQEAAKEEYEDKQKELEAIANPIMQKAYAAAGGPPGGPGGAPGGFPGAGGAAPPGAGADEVQVEEID